MVKLLSPPPLYHGITERCLSLAVMRGKYDIVEWLLSLETRPHDHKEQTKAQYCPPYDVDFLMRMACEHGHLDIVRLLVEKYGADVNLEHHRKSPLMCACDGLNEHPDVVSYLMEKGAEVNPYIDIVAHMIAPDFYIIADSCLSRAAGRGYTATVKLLLENGAKVDDKALKHAVTSYRKGTSKIVEMLIQHGASITSSMANIAVEHFKTKIVRMFLAKGVKV